MVCRWSLAYALVVAVALIGCDDGDGGDEAAGGAAGSTSTGGADVGGSGSGGRTIDNMEDAGPAADPDAAAVVEDAGGAGGTGGAEPDAALPEPDAGPCADGPRPEQCNSIDDDCDGEVDEDFNVGRACIIRDPNCDRRGVLRCVSPVASECFAEPNPPELCNEQDDDCDGMVDEGYVLGEPCEVGVGRCAGEGVTACGGGMDVVCSADVNAPRDETCNGLDDDCDGMTDEALGEAEGVGVPCTSGVGACVREGLTTCPADGRGGFSFEGIQQALPEREILDGGFELCWSGVYTQSNSQIADVLEACDGDILLLGCRPQDAPELTIAAMGEREAVLADTDRDRNPMNLHNGVNWYFSDSYSWGFGPAGEPLSRNSCDTGNTQPQLRMCWHTSGGRVNSGYRCGQVFPNAGNQYERRIYHRVGTLEGSGLVCDAEPGPPGAESCNAVDDDCDEAVDEDTELGDGCDEGVGFCQFGTVACSEDGPFCEVQDTVPTPEICNGIDDDCDMEVDNVDGLGDDCSVGTGECTREAVLVCGEGPEPVCDASPGEPVEDICNNRDDDCDGQTDEDFPVGGACSFGVGACRAEGVIGCFPEGAIGCLVEAPPAAEEACNGADDDCDGRVDEGVNCDGYASCLAALEAGNTESGVYNILPEGNEVPLRAWCDMETDGGGWTLVAAAGGTPLVDVGSGHDPQLVNLAPEAEGRGVWRGVSGASHDMRFACRAAAGAAEDPMTVDLSFYDVPWYGQIVGGMADADSCFAQGGTPARTNNLTGDFRPRGTAFAGGAFAGEAACDDAESFTVDFDDRGVGGMRDATDWGESEGAALCGEGEVENGQWFVFARERRPAPAFRGRVAVLGFTAARGALHRAGYDVELPEPGEAFGMRLRADPPPAALLIGDVSAEQWAALGDADLAALHDYADGGGAIVAIYDGAALFGLEYLPGPVRGIDGGAPPFAGGAIPAVGPLGWFDVNLGAGDANLPGGGRIDAVAPGDRLFSSVPAPFLPYAQPDGDRYLDAVDAEGRTPTLRVAATRPGAEGDVPAVLAGSRCGGQVVLALNNWTAQSAHPLFGAWLDDLLGTATLDGAAGAQDVCPNALQPRAEIHVCGAAGPDLATYRPEGVRVRITESCAVDANTQALVVTDGMPPEAEALRAWIAEGGVLVASGPGAAPLYATIFEQEPVEAPAVEPCEGVGLYPAARQNERDPLWRVLDFVAGFPTGCGGSLAAQEGLTALGGWDAETVSLGYRQLDSGRVWLVAPAWYAGERLDPPAGELLYAMMLARADLTPPAVAIPGAYGNHGSCNAWNACQNAEGCARWACEFRGFGPPVSWEETDQCVQNQPCTLFRGNPNNPEENYRGCVINGAINVLCEAL